VVEPSLALQIAIRQRLVASSAVTSLVPAANILDKNARPEVFPCIIIGESMTLPGDMIARNDYVTHADVHIWLNEAGTVGAKQVAGAIRQALSDRFYDLDSHHLTDLYIESCRFLRDENGVHSHGVMTLNARLIEAVA
jgi:hypothetical protein